MNQVGKAPIEQLPAGIIGNILHQLNRQSNVISRAGISAVMRCVRSLACTSKRMNLMVNHSQAVCMFLNSLAEKYRQPPENFAAVLNTKGASKWLWEYIQTNGDAQSYQAIQDIYDLAAEVLNEVQEENLHCNYYVARKGPDPFIYQTKQGFMLYIDKVPCYIATPFGQIEIYNGQSDGYLPFSISEVFIKKLEATFACNTLGKDGECAFEVFTQSNKIRKITKDDIKQISKEELEKKEGAQNVIVYGFQFARYNIKEIKRKKVPDVLWDNPGHSKRSYKAIKKIWQMLCSGENFGDN